MITKCERRRKRLKDLRNRSMVRWIGPAGPPPIFGEQRSGTNMLLRCFAT